MKLGFERKKTSPWMSNLFEKHNAYADYIILWAGWMVQDHNVFSWD
jgi:hypothetical protein